MRDALRPCNRRRNNGGKDTQVDLWPSVMPKRSEFGKSIDGGVGVVERMTGHDDPERTEVVDGVPFPSRLPAPETLLGTVLADRFECRSILGQGSTGTVYRAIQQPLGRPVAVKICWIRDDYTGDRVARFLSEASLAGGLQHPNVVTVHDFGRTDDGACYMVMELLEGVSLRSQMDGQPMRLGRFLALFDQILSGLRHAHRSGLVHRDMKPGNIQVMKSDEGRMRQNLDFGLVQRDGEGVPEERKAPSGYAALRP